MAKKPELKKIKVNQADPDGIITESSVMVSSAHFEGLMLPFGKRWKEYVALREKVTELIAAVFAKQKEAFAESKPTPGEAAIVLKKIEDKRDRTTRKTISHSYRTLELIVRNFDMTDASISVFGEILDDTEYTHGVTGIREAIVFYRAFNGESYHSVIPILDNLRTCHPMLAREDLSELDEKSIEMVKILLRIAIKDRDKADKKRISKMTRGAFASDIEDARREIVRCTPNMTPALTRVVLDHPEKLDQVLQTLEERNVPIAQSDSLVHEIVNASTPLSSGVL